MIPTPELRRDSDLVDGLVAQSEERLPWSLESPDLRPVLHQHNSLWALQFGQSELWFKSPVSWW